MPLSRRPPTLQAADVLRSGTLWLSVCCRSGSAAMCSLQPKIITLSFAVQSQCPPGVHLLATEALRKQPWQLAASSRQPSARPEAARSSQRRQGAATAVVEPPCQHQSCTRWLYGIPLATDYCNFIN